MSCTVLNVTTALPIGVAVWLTLSLTSYAVILIFVSVVNPSLARKLTVVKKFGLLLRWNRSRRNSYRITTWRGNSFREFFVVTSTTSVRAYLIQVLEDLDCTSISKTGVGGRPCPSHNRLSQASDISHIGTSAGSGEKKKKKSVQIHSREWCTSNFTYASCIKNE